MSFRLPLKYYIANQRFSLHWIQKQMENKWGNVYYIHKLKWSKNLHKFIKYLRKQNHINKTKCKFMMMTCIHCISILVKLVSENAAAEVKKGSTIKPWSKEEIDAIKRSLQGHINTMTCPGKGPCVEANEKEPALKERDWYSVKYKAAYLITKKKKRLESNNKKKVCTP